MGYPARRHPRVDTGSLRRAPGGSYSMDAMAGGGLEVPEVVSSALIDQGADLVLRRISTNFRRNRTGSRRIDTGWSVGVGYA